MKKKLQIWLTLLLAGVLILCLACSKPDQKSTEQNDGTRTGEVAETTSDASIDPVSATEAPVEEDPIAIVTPEPDLHRAELEAILNRTTMLDGVAVNGVFVGGMTLEQARAAVLPTVESAKKELRIDVQLGDVKKTFSGETVATTDNLDEVLKEAYALVREDKGFEEVSQEVAAIKSAGKDFSVSIAFDETALRAAVDAFADAHETKPVDASVAYNKEENKIDFTPDVTGVTIDREALVDALLSAKGGDTVTVKAVETKAAVTLADVQAKYVLRSTYTTKYSKSIENRKYNIFKGAGMITGTILHPGDTFSANGTLGVRNKENGWRVATAYVGGAHEKQYGGGVCQLSSTLYNAAVLADMKIVDRRNHSMPVDYVDKGRDATINSIGNLIDFKFQNSSKSDIIIIAYVDNENFKKAGKLTMEIWGIPISEDSNGAYDEIRIPTPKKTKTIKPSGDVKYEVDVSKPVGYKEQTVKKQDGSVWESTKEYYLNGKLVKSEPLATSTYRAYTAVYLVGPDPTPAPSASPSPTPTAPAATPTPGKETPTPGKETPTPTAPGKDTPEPATPTPVVTPKPTDPPEDTPKPTDPPQDTPKPTDPPADTPKPTDPPSDEGGEE